MGVMPPATPPSTVVSAQSSPVSPTGVFANGFESDLEKGQYNEKNEESNNGIDVWRIIPLDPPLTAFAVAEPPIKIPQNSVAGWHGWVQKFAPSAQLPHDTWRKEDGREKLVQRSTGSVLTQSNCRGLRLTKRQLMTTRKDIPN